MIPESTIEGWKSQLSDLLETSRNGRMKNSLVSQCVYPQMESALFDQFWQRREDGRTVRRGWFRTVGKQNFLHYYPKVNSTSFVFSNGWFLGFLNCW